MVPAALPAVAPWLQNAAAGAGILGTGLSAYGQYQQAKQAERQYELALRAWQDEQQRQKRLDAQAEEQRTLDQHQRGITNSLNAGQYASGQADDIEDPYVAYARQLGL